MNIEDVKENKSKRLNRSLLVEKFRPVTIKDVILPESIKKGFNKIIKDKEIPNMLFFSSSADPPGGSRRRKTGGDRKCYSRTKTSVPINLTIGTLNAVSLWISNH